MTGEDEQRDVDDHEDDADVVTDQPHGAEKDDEHDALPEHERLNQNRDFYRWSEGDIRQASTYRLEKHEAHAEAQIGHSGDEQWTAIGYQVLGAVPAHDHHEENV